MNIKKTLTFDDTPLANVKLFPSPYRSGDFCIARVDYKDPTNNIQIFLNRDESSIVVVWLDMYNKVEDTQVFSESCHEVSEWTMEDFVREVLDNFDIDLEYWDFVFERE